jgi:hypothetical protein
MPKFVLSNAEKGQTVLAGRYAFVDGEMQVSKSDALKLERILCRFHGCEVVYDEEPQSEKKEAKDSSLAADVTKTGSKVEAKAETNAAAKA